MIWQELLSNLTADLMRSWLNIVEFWYLIPVMAACLVGLGLLLRGGE